ncbi:MAG: hypothetical protein ACR2NZ_17740 [Rubripirellula sp.]
MRNIYAVLFILALTSPVIAQSEHQRRNALTREEVTAKQQQRQAILRAWKQNSNDHFKRLRQQRSEAIEAYHANPDDPDAKAKAVAMTEAAKKLYLRIFEKHVAMQIWDFDEDMKDQYLGSGREMPEDYERRLVDYRASLAKKKLRPIDWNIEPTQKN